MNFSPFSKFVIISVLLHILLLTALFFAIKNRKKAPETPMVARLITPGELKQLPIPKVLKPKPQRPKQKVFKEQKRQPPVRRMPLPRLTPEQLKDLRLHGGLTQGSPRIMKKAEKSKTPPSRKAGSLSARKGQGRRSPLAKSAPTAKGPGYLGKSSPNGNKNPGTRLVKPDLFDPGIIGQIASNDGHQKDNSSSKKGAITFDTHDMRYMGYMRLLRIKIESIWKYPDQAAERRLQGDLEISFTIHKDGSLSDVEVVRTSGYPILDEAAVQALREGIPYWPLPDAWHQKKLTIVGHFVYSLYGTPQVW